MLLWIASVAFLLLLVMSQVFSARNGSSSISLDLLNTELMPWIGREAADALIGLPVCLREPLSD